MNNDLRFVATVEPVVFRHRTHHRHHYHPNYHHNQSTTTAPPSTPNREEASSSAVGHPTAVITTSQQQEQQYQDDDDVSFLILFEIATQEGYGYMRSGNASEALDRFGQALRLYRRIEDKKATALTLAVADVLFSIGSIHYYSVLATLASNNNNKNSAAKKADNNNNNTDIVIIKSLQAFQLCLDFMSACQKNTDQSIAIVLKKTASVYCVMQEHDKAIELLSKALNFVLLRTTEEETNCGQQQRQRRQQKRGTASYAKGAARRSSSSSSLSPHHHHRRRQCQQKLQSDIWIALGQQLEAIGRINDAAQCYKEGVRCI